MAERPFLPEPGAVLGGKYRIVRRVGEGGMGVVYEAAHVRLKQRVAIKMLLPDLITQPDIVTRFEREARAAGQLRSNNVARVLDVEATAEGLPYMVMEFLDGIDLSVQLVERGPMVVAQAVDVVLQTCNAMREAHRLGIVHRDLKPSNLFLTTEGARPVIKVLDFGISKVEDDREARMTGTQATVGTPLYMSPEQIRSAKHVDARTDVWSLGIILYELLAGRTPYEGSTTAAAVAICVDPVPSLRAIRPDVSPELEAVILRALEKQRERRYQTIDEFAAALVPFAAGDASLSYQSSPSLPAPVSTSGAHAALARTEAGDQPSLEGAKRHGAATESPWSTHAGRSKRRSNAAWWGAGAIGVVAVAGAIATVVWTRPREKVTAIEAPKPTVSVVVVTPSASATAVVVDSPPAVQPPKPKPSVTTKVTTSKTAAPPVVSAPPPASSKPTPVTGPTAAPTHL